MTKLSTPVLILAMPILSMLQGCAHSVVEKQLDEKLERETVVKSRSDLMGETDHLIKTAPGLSEDQRTRLLGLRDSTRAQSDRLREESLKLRSVLVKSLVSINYDQEETDLVKTRIRNLEHERLSLFFRTVRQANEILGRWGSQQQQVNEDFYNQMLMLDLMNFY